MILHHGMTDARITKAAHLGGSCYDDAQLLVLLHCQAGAAWAITQEVFDALAVDLYHRQVYLLSKKSSPQCSKHLVRLAAHLMTPVVRQPPA